MHLNSGMFRVCMRCKTFTNSCVFTSSRGEPWLDRFEIYRGESVTLYAQIVTYDATIFYIILLYIILYIITLSLDYYYVFILYFNKITLNKISDLGFEDFLTSQVPSSPKNYR